LTATNCDVSTAFLSPTYMADIASNTVEESPGDGREGFLNVILLVPDDVVDEYHFGSRLPVEVRRLFPEFSSARVSIVEPFVGQQRLLSLQIPVLRPLEGDVEMERLLSIEMQFTAKLLGGKEDAVTIDLSPQVLVRHLKQKIADEFLLPCGSFKVINGGKPLIDEDLQLPAVGLKDGAKLMVVLSTGDTTNPLEDHEMEARLKTILGEFATPLNMLRLQQSIQNYVNFMSLDDLERYAKIKARSGSSNV
uniref:Ubiquitin-like domain-containing protein n=1 Tax=Angiostrongylus cantonensis TaxID=6313 RepID=A0A0K0DKI3_ANGCA